MAKIKREKGLTIWDSGNLVFRTNLINRHKYNELRKKEHVKLGEVLFATGKLKKKRK